MTAHFVTEVEVDPRRRISLGRAGDPSHKRYRVDEDEFGVLTLTPILSIAITDLDDRLREAVQDALAGKTYPRPDHSRPTEAARS